MNRYVIVAATKAWKTHFYQETSQALLGIEEGAVLAGEEFEETTLYFEIHPTTSQVTGYLNTKAGEWS